MSLPSPSDAINTLTGTWKAVGVLMTLTVALVLVATPTAISAYTAVLAANNNAQLVRLRCTGVQGGAISPRKGTVVLERSTPVPGPLP